MIFKINTLHKECYISLKDDSKTGYDLLDFKMNFYFYFLTRD